MRNISKGVLAALAASTAMAGAAHADETSFSGNVAITTDYVFRGVSQTDGGPAVQGGFDFVEDKFYAGTWASNIDFGADGTLELDLYGGFTPTVGPVTLDLGFVYYWYPNLDADGGTEADMLELKAAAGISPTENLALKASLFYSPDFTYTPGEEAGLYAEVAASYTVSDTIGVSGAIGNQSVDVDGYYGNAGDPTDNYTTFNVGATYSAYGFSFDLRYFDTDIEIPGPSADDLAKGRGVFTIKRAL
jgi:uncharacterized protein (TIGR02001 family)